MGKGREVAACTHMAMSGNMSFREALRLRLNLMRPTRDQMEEYAKTHRIRLTNGITDLISELQKRNIHVYLVLLFLEYFFQYRLKINIIIIRGVG